MPRGAQPGNQNALKHGFYSRIRKEAALAVLAEARCVNGLDEEIALARYGLRKLLEKRSDSAPKRPAPAQGHQNAGEALGGP